jgi:hypothetical protein
MLYTDLITILQEQILTGGTITSTNFGVIQDYIEHNKTFPFGFIEPGQPAISYEPYYTNYSFRIYFLDQLQKDKFNELEIINNMERFVHTYIRRLAYLGQTYIWNVEWASSNLEVVFWQQDEELAGVVFNLLIRKEENNTADCYGA